jgi:hypothetical protein
MSVTVDNLSSFVTEDILFAYLKSLLPDVVPLAIRLACDDDESFAYGIIEMSSEEATSADFFDDGLAAFEDDEDEDEDEEAALLRSGASFCLPMV